MSDFEEQLAAAMLAKLAGTSLMQIDQQTVQPSSSGRAARIDPASFLVGLQQKKQEQEQQKVQQLNQIAEQLHPLPPPIQPLPPSPPQEPISSSPPLVSSELTEILKSIDSSLKTFVKNYQTTHNIVS